MTTGRRTATVAVVIPHGGVIHLLRTQLAAVLATRRDVEVIVSCNREGGLERLEATSWPELLDHRVRLIDSSHVKGPSAARNAGWRSTVADLVLFCDDDDVVSPQWIDEMVQSLVYSDIVVGQLDYSVLNEPKLAKSSKQATSGAPVKFGHLEFGSSCNLGFRRAVLDSVNGFDEEWSCAEDIDICWRAQYAGYSLTYAGGAVVNYRLRESASETWKQSFAYGRSDAILLARHYQFGARRRLIDTLIELNAVPLSAIQVVLGIAHPHKFLARTGSLFGRGVGSWEARRWAL